ncbi:MAG: PilT/PilU family type 4a pilus ATPase [Desulfobacterales bacterium]|nr:PilT/PilU family type 4a pilus ATPase [Desulfobacterales bacterium]
MIDLKDIVNQTGIREALIRRCLREIKDVFDHFAKDESGNNRLFDSKVLNIFEFIKQQTHRGLPFNELKQNVLSFVKDNKLLAQDDKSSNPFFQTEVIPNLIQDVDTIKHEFINLKDSFNAKLVKEDSRFEDNKNIQKDIDELKKDLNKIKEDYGLKEKEYVSLKRLDYDEELNDRIEKSELAKLFKFAVELGASDVHVVPNEPYLVRRFGKIMKTKGSALSSEQAKKLIFEIFSESQKAKFLHDFQIDFAIDIKNLGRFRGSAMTHQRGVSAIFRLIPPNIPAIETLGLPLNTVKKVLDNHQGLILVTGATGQGKSTTLASMIDYINATRSHHILTVEDPIEFIHPLKKGVVNQRQLSVDTLSYGNALRAALRQNPDVIVVGELRDLETTSLAISASETGHLVIGTLATSSAAKTIDRIIDSFPAVEQAQIRAMLSESLKAVITQRLIPVEDNKGMVLACEILIGTIPLGNLIRDAKTFQIHSLMQTGRNVGMQLMDDSIMALVMDEKITAETAYHYATKPANFKKLLDELKKEQKEQKDETTT